MMGIKTYSSFVFICLYLSSAYKREILAVIHRDELASLIHTCASPVYCSLSGYKTTGCRTYSIHFPVNRCCGCNFFNNLIDKPGTLCIVYQNLPGKYKPFQRAIRKGYPYTVPDVWCSLGLNEWWHYNSYDTCLPHHWPELVRN
jgi:hypothetical protein